jgi:hypothetical protein
MLPGMQFSFFMLTLYARTGREYLSGEGQIIRPSRESQ